jgi:3-isopropylmalate dehydrogenase
VRLRIAVLPGDGVGPEVTTEAIKVLETVASRFGHQVEAEEHPFGGEAISTVGNCFPRETRRACLESQGIFLGAVGDPIHDHLSLSERPEAAIMGLRRELGSWRCRFCGERSSRR